MSRKPSSIRRRKTDPERVPLTEAHQHGILDPMTASLVRCRAPATCCRRKPASARWRFSTAGCATTCNSPTSAWTRSRRTRAMPARWWSAPSISRRSPATSRRARRSDTSTKHARHGGVAGADRRHARAGAVPRPRADADRPGHARADNSSRHALPTRASANGLKTQ